MKHTSKNNSMHLYRAETMQITVEVRPEFIGVNVVGNDHVYVYHYTIMIENMSPQPCQILRRHWIIRNGFGEEEHIRGDGVVGRQPIIQPGKNYSYTSGCSLPTQTGSMRGSYRICWTDQEAQSDIAIPLFFLRIPQELQGGRAKHTPTPPQVTRH